MTSGKRLGGGADAAVVNGGAAFGEQLAERGVVDMDDGIGQLGGKFFAMLGEEDAAELAALAGFDGFFEEVMAGPHGASGGEGDRSRARSEKVRKLWRKF